MAILPMIERKGAEGRIFEYWRGSMGELVGGTGGVAAPAGMEDLLASLREGDGRECVAAGLWLLAGDLDLAHGICQDIANRFGAAWHAVMHRREGDFWNSKYWWRRASGLQWRWGSGGLHEELGRMFAGAVLPEEMRAGLSRGYDPAVFVDWVEKWHRSGTKETVEALVAIQRMEWAALFLECVDAARV